MKDQTDHDQGFIQYVQTSVSGRLIAYYHRLIYYIGVVNLLVSKVLLGSILVLITFQVVARIAAGRAPGGINEFSRYAVIWISYLLIYNLLVTDDHLKVEFVVKRLPPLVQKTIQGGVLVALTIFGFEMVVRGWGYATDLGFQSAAPTLPGDIPMFYFYIVIPICGLFVSIASVYRLLDVVGVLEISNEVKSIGGFGEDI